MSPNLPFWPIQVSCVCRARRDLYRPYRGKADPFPSAGTHPLSCYTRLDYGGTKPARRADRIHLPSAKHYGPDTLDFPLYFCMCRERETSSMSLYTLQGPRGMDHRPDLVVVEDETTQRQLLVDYLTRQNFRVSGASGSAALRKIVERDLPAVVLLDVGLPGEDGFALARWLREKSARIGIIMVTAASETVDRVVGLETGADDYIAKPFEPRELLARVKSVLRRATGAMVTAGPRVRMGRRVLDLEKRVLVDPADGREETLTASEFDLLKAFAENPHRPLQRDWLLEVTAHREMETFDRAIDLRITRLRRKIERDPTHPDAIRTVRGVGYMFVPPTG